MDEKISLDIEGRSLELEPHRAEELLKKGLSHEAIEQEIEQIRALAQKNGESLPDFVERISLSQRDDEISKLTELCGGNEEIARELHTLRNGKAEKGIKEVAEFFPEIDSADKLPLEAVVAAEQRNTALIDEYLRYLARRKKISASVSACRRRAAQNSTGSQKSKNTRALDPVRQEFIKGIWGR